MKTIKREKLERKKPQDWGFLAVVCWTAAALLPAGSSAQSLFSEDFTGSTTTHSWYATGGACLTVGTASGTATSTTAGSIPSCMYLKNSGTYYTNDKMTGGVTGTLPDPAGQGALRFTNGANTGGSSDSNGSSEKGSIWSSSPFPAGGGIQINFKSVTYRGAGNSPYDGADGMSFYLIDATKVTPGDGYFNGVGADGGSLGYSCSNTNQVDGLAGAYMGLGIDEFGNFLDGATVLIPTVSTTGFITGQTQDGNDWGGVSAPQGGSNFVGYDYYNGDNTATGYGFYPYGRIGLRGAGNITWAALHKAYGSYYPTLTASTPGVAVLAAASVYHESVASVTAAQISALTTAQLNAEVTYLEGTEVQNTCITGKVLDYSATATSALNYNYSGTYSGKTYTQCNLYGTSATSHTTAGTSSCPSVVTSAPALADYAAIPNAFTEFPKSGTAGAVVLAAENATTRPTGGTANQNIFLYSLKITQDGLLSFSYSVNGGPYTSILSNQSISASNGSLPSNLYFGFAGATGGGTNIHEILCFQAAPASQSASSAGGDEKQVSEIQAGTQDYFAYYDPNDYTGRMTAYTLVDTNGVLTVASLANWDAQCVLTGTTNCVNTGVAGPTSPEAPTSRSMVTWNGTNADSTTNLGTAGVPFEWTSGISTKEQNILDAGDSTPYTADRLNYLRGNRTLEYQSNGTGSFRARTGVLGDIVDSSPTWVGPPSSPYAIVWADRLDSGDTMLENSGTSYASFQSSNQSRTNVVYIGANDGFLHGFRAGVESSTGVVSGTNDGYEVFAYMPGAVLNTIHNYTTSSLDFSAAQYTHNFYVDATPGSGDLHYEGAWHTWLVGGLGSGGAAIYAIDVTSPTNFSPEITAAGLVMGEWSSATISCQNVSSCGKSLGNTYGQPQIRRFHNGTWGAIFGNGYGSTSGDAGIYVMTVNQTSGQILFYYLSTATSGTSNGIASVTPADLDGDHITDYVYAGDLNGHVWRFDLTSTNPSNWAVTTGGPLFKTQSGQPITSQIVVASSLVTGSTPQVMVAFGSGQRNQFTNTSSATYVTGTQSLYGVWDWNLSAWNALSSTQYVALTQAEFSKSTSISASPYTLSYSNLQAQTFTAASTSATSAEVPVTTSNTAFTYVTCTSSTSCAAGEFGWYANLRSTQGATNPSGGSMTEQIVSNPSLYQGALLVNSTIPANVQLLSCAAPNVDTGVTYVLSATWGGTFVGGGGSTSGSKSSAFPAYVNTQTVGLPNNETGSLLVANTAEGTTYLVGQKISVSQGSAPGGTSQIILPSNTTANRVTWVQLR